MTQEEEIGKLVLELATKNDVLTIAVRDGITYVMLEMPKRRNIYVDDKDVYKALLKASQAKRRGL